MLMLENVEKIQKALVAELSELKRKIKCYQLLMEFEAIFGFLFSVIWCVVLRSTECSGRCRFRMDPRARAVKTTTQDQNRSDHITVTCEFEYERRKFKVKPSTKLQKIQNTFCERKNLL